MKDEAGTDVSNDSLWRSTLLANAARDGAGSQRQTGAQGVGTVGLLRVVTAQQLPGFVVAAELHHDVNGVELNCLVFRRCLAGLDQLGQRFLQPAFGDQRRGFLAQVAAGAAGRAMRSRKSRIWLSGSTPLNSSTSCP